MSATYDLVVSGEDGVPLVHTLDCAQVPVLRERSIPLMTMLGRERMPIDGFPFPFHDCLKENPCPDTV